MLEPPKVFETSYGLTFIVWRFKPNVEDIFDILRSDDLYRDFDLVHWSDKEGSYSIYNSHVDLSELKQFGGSERGTKRFKGRAMRFRPKFPGFLTDDEFLEMLIKNPDSLKFAPLPHA